MWKPLRVVPDSSFGGCEQGRYSIPVLLDLIGKGFVEGSSRREVANWVDSGIRGEDIADGVSEEHESSAGG